MAAVGWRQGAYTWRRQVDGHQPTRRTLDFIADKATDPARPRLLYPNEAALDWYNLTGLDHWDASAAEASDYASGVLRSNLHRISQALQWALIVVGGPSRHATYATKPVRTLALNSPDGINAKAAYQQLGASKHSRMLIESTGSAIVKAVQAATANEFEGFTATTNIIGGGRRNARATGCGIELDSAADPDQTSARLTIRVKAGRSRRVVVDVQWSAGDAGTAKAQALAKADVPRSALHVVVWPNLRQLLKGPDCPQNYTVHWYVRTP